MEPYIDKAFEATALVINETIVYNQVNSSYALVAVTVATLILTKLAFYFWHKSENGENEGWMWLTAGSVASAGITLLALLGSVVPYFTASWFAPTARAIKTLLS
jgi:small-conductance mechanosensitive channel